MTHLHPLSGLIFDMDGVLWRGETLLPGARELFAHLRENGTAVTLVTNNATSTPESIRSRLQGWGIEVGLDEVLTSAVATAAYMHGELEPGAAVYVIGESGLQEAIKRAGFTIVDRADGAAAVAVGMDHNLSWDKLAEATLALRSGAAFYGTNPDPTFPTERGQVPGNGSILAALIASSDVDPIVIGKPEPHLFEQALARMGVPANEAFMLGDRLSTDILGAQRAAIRAGLMLTGVTSFEQVQRGQVRPDFIFQDLNEFLLALRPKSHA